MLACHNYWHWALYLIEKVRRPAAGSRGDVQRRRHFSALAMLASPWGNVLRWHVQTGSRSEVAVVLPTGVSGLTPAGVGRPRRPGRPCAARGAGSRPVSVRGHGVVGARPAGGAGCRGQPEPSVPCSRECGARSRRPRLRARTCAVGCGGRGPSSCRFQLSARRRVSLSATAVTGTSFPQGDYEAALTIYDEHVSPRPAPVQSSPRRDSRSPQMSEPIRVAPARGSGGSEHGFPAGDPTAECAPEVVA